MNVNMFRSSSLGLTSVDWNAASTGGRFLIPFAPFGRVKLRLQNPGCEPWRKIMNRRIARITRRIGVSALLTGCLSLGLAGQLMAARLVDASSHDKSAERCVSDLSAFDDELQKGGYWLHDAGYGYGYPMYGYMFGERGVMLPSATAATVTALHARPGYEIRTLMASANIMAQHGQQAACEALLAVTREIYRDYAADLHKRGVPKSDKTGWQNHVLAAAQPVSASTTPFRSDQLIGTDDNYTAQRKSRYRR